MNTNKDKGSKGSPYMENAEMRARLQRAEEAIGWLILGLVCLGALALVTAMLSPAQYPPESWMALGAFITAGFLKFVSHLYLTTEGLNEDEGTEETKR